MSKVNCIDVSTWQTDIDFKKLKNQGIDTVIIRAGFGTAQEDDQFKNHYKNAIKSKFKVGVYWYSYALNLEYCIKEAQACYKVLRKYDVPYTTPVFFDCESNCMRNYPELLTQGCINFCEELKNNKYKNVGVYANAHYFTNYLNYEKLSKLYNIWVAQYFYKCELKCDIWQNSSKGQIKGVNGNCDTDIIYNKSIFVPIKSKSIKKKKSISDLVKEVIAGKWGNGNERKNRLTKAGYNYKVVQNAVNNKLMKKSNEDIAKEVIAGKWGNGNERKNRLTKAGYNYKDVQTIVNKIMEVN